MLQLALESYMKTDRQAILFFTCDALLLLKDNSETVMAMLQSYADKGLDLKKNCYTVKGRKGNGASRIV